MIKGRLTNLPMRFSPWNFTSWKSKCQYLLKCNCFYRYIIVCLRTAPWSIPYFRRNTYPYNYASLKSTIFIYFRSCYLEWIENIITNILIPHLYMEKDWGMFQGSLSWKYAQLFHITLTVYVFHQTIYVCLLERSSACI